MSILFGSLCSIMAIFSFPINAVLLHQAINNGDRQAAITILNQSAESIYELDSNGNSPLHSAAQMEDSSLVILLLERGANPDSCNNFGQKPRDLARDRDAFDMLVLENGAINFLISQKSTLKDAHTHSLNKQQRQKEYQTKDHFEHRIQGSRRETLNPAGFPLGKLSRKNPMAKAFECSILSDKRASFACLPGKEYILGRGKQGKVKLAKLIYIHESSPAVVLFQPGEEVAIKYQEEPFDEEEIEALRRQGLLIAGPIKYDIHGARFAIVMKLIRGKTLWDRMLMDDPNKVWGIKEFLGILKIVNKSLSSQVHSHYISFQDSNLHNFMVTDQTNEIAIVDFGNAFIFDPKERYSIEFADCCTTDFIMVFAAIFHYLHENAYPENVQNEFWIEAFEFAFLYLKKFDGKSEDICGKSAYRILYGFAYSIPPFLEKIYGKNGVENSVKNPDEIIWSHIDDYLGGEILIDK